MNLNEMTTIPDNKDKHYNVSGTAAASFMDPK